MRFTLTFSAILLLFIVGVSCTNDDDTPTPAPDTLTFTAHLSGTNEVPTNNSTAKGTATLVYSKTTKVFTIKVIYSGLAPTSVLIHKGAVNTADPKVFTVGEYSDYNSFYNDPTDALPIILYTSPVLTVEQEANLLSNQYYLNLYSSAYPEGDIRGQLIYTDSDEY